ncbi:hypothetical protein BH18THE2_BH18THE2_38750 [soil metagenome]
MDISILSYDGTIYKYILQLIEDKECFIQRRVSGDSKVSLYGGKYVNLTFVLLVFSLC